ncbi:hypothetical protein ACLOJK_012894 [Asimina triloba]
MRWAPWTDGNFLRQALAFGSRRVEGSVSLCVESQQSLFVRARRPLGDQIPGTKDERAACERHKDGVSSVRRNLQKARVHFSLVTLVSFARSTEDIMYDFLTEMKRKAECCNVIQNNVVCQLLRENKRMLDKSIREIERERQGLQTQEKKLIAEIKKSAKQGQMGAVRVMAKDLIRTRHQITKFYALKSQLQGVSLRIQTLKSTQAMGEAMKGVTKAMGQMNRQMNLPALQKIMQEFERQNERMEMVTEVMGDAIDDALEGDEEEEETDELVNQVLDEIGIDVDQQGSYLFLNSVVRLVAPVGQMGDTHPGSYQKPNGLVGLVENLRGVKLDGQFHDGSAKSHMISKSESPPNSLFEVMGWYTVKEEEEENRGFPDFEYFDVTLLKAPSSAVSAPAAKTKVAQAEASGNDDGGIDNELQARLDNLRKM